MGAYDSGRYSQNKYQMERQDARDELAGKLAAREADSQRYIADQEYAGATNYGDEMAKGAMLGTAIKPGWGTAIGAGVGALAGGKQAYDARRAQGQGGFEALLGTVTDLPNQLGNILSSPSAVPLAMMGGRALAGQSGTADASVPTSDPLQGTSTGGAYYAQPDGSFQFENGSYDQKLLSPDEYEAFHGPQRL